MLPDPQQDSVPERKNAIKDIIRCIEKIGI